MRDEKVTERISLMDLQRMAKTARKINLPIIVIGGYAIEGYTEGYRFTKDIDFVTLKTGLSKLIPLLKEIGYHPHKSQFGITGVKKVDKNFIDLHISIDKVYDVSTDSSYPISEETLKNARTKKINGYYEENKNLNVSIKIISLEELLLLKLMTKGRDKDITDIVSLLMDKRGEINIKQFIKCCEKARLKDHISERVSDFIINVRNGDTRKTWEQMTGRRLAWKDEQETAGFLKRLLKTIQSA